MSSIFICIKSKQSAYRVATGLTQRETLVMQGYWKDLNGKFKFIVAIESIQTSFKLKRGKVMIPKEMLHSIDADSWSKKIVWFTLNQRFYIFDYPATSKQTGNRLVDPEVHSASRGVGLSSFTT